MGDDLVKRLMKKVLALEKELDSRAGTIEFRTKENTRLKKQEAEFKLKIKETEEKLVEREIRLRNLEAEFKRKITETEEKLIERDIHIMRLEKNCSDAQAKLETNNQVMETLRNNCLRNLTRKEKLIAELEAQLAKSKMENVCFYMADLNVGEGNSRRFHFQEGVIKKLTEENNKLKQELEKDAQRMDNTREYYVKKVEDLKSKMKTEKEDLFHKMKVRDRELMSRIEQRDKELIFTMKQREQYFKMDMRRCEENQRQAEWGKDNSGITEVDDKSGKNVRNGEGSGKYKGDEERFIEKGYKEGFGKSEVAGKSRSMGQTSFVSDLDLDMQLTELSEEWKRNLDAILQVFKEKENVLLFNQLPQLDHQ